MKTAVMFHGSGGSPEVYWFPYIRRALERIGYRTWVPQLPDVDSPNLDSWLRTALSFDGYNDETVVIGHSSGCALILALLQRLDVQVGQAILVAGYARPLTDEPNPILQDSYDWDRIRARAAEFMFINSDNDPWGCDDRSGRYMLERLGGSLLIPAGQGHMGSDSYDQPYREFPLLLRQIAGREVS